MADALSGAVGTLRSFHEPVMGTHLELQVTAGDEDVARAVEASIVADARRLEATFTVFDPASELCRWRSGSLADDEASDELVALLSLVASWQRRSLGTFNPLAGVLTERWLRAADEGVVPSDEELAALAASIAEPRFEVAEGRGGRDGAAVRRLGSCDALDLNALAKGHVVDLVASRAMADGSVDRLVVNAGGDLVHRGSGSLRVRVEDPSAAYDNAAPALARIELVDAAVATSGRSRRWFEVGGRRWSRVLDPRTGWPVEASASATVVAPDAATADVLATVASVLPPEDAVAFVDAVEGVGDVACLVADGAGHLHRSSGWSALVLDA